MKKNILTIIVFICILSIASYIYSKNKPETQTGTIDFRLQKITKDNYYSLLSSTDNSLNSDENELLKLALEYYSGDNELFYENVSYAIEKGKQIKLCNDKEMYINNRLSELSSKYNATLINDIFENDYSYTLEYQEELEKNKCLFFSYVYDIFKTSNNNFIVCVNDEYDFFHFYLEVSNEQADYIIANKENDFFFVVNNMQTKAINELISTDYEQYDADEIYPYIQIEQPYYCSLFVTGNLEYIEKLNFNEI